MTLRWSSSYGPVDEDFADVSLLLKGEGANNSTTILDSSSNNLSVSVVNDAKISTTVATPFSPTVPSDGVLAFDGTGDYLALPDSTDWDLPNDFTIESWVYLTGYSGPYAGLYGASVISQYNFQGGSPQGWQLRINGTASSYTDIYVFTGNTELTFATTVSLNTWTHVAVTRSGSSIRVFVNGVQAGSTITNNDSFTEGASRTLWVGGLNDSTYRFWLPGYISNLRITKGVARYTENFDIPTAPFPIYSPTTRAQA
jgi:hypothetical protein